MLATFNKTMLMKRIEAHLYINKEHNFNTFKAKVEIFLPNLLLVILVDVIYDHLTHC